MEERWHRHLGVYGICARNRELLVINKIRGPYKNRYDLPGGTVEPSESLADAIHREFQEETGYDIEIVQNLGVRDFIVPQNPEIRETTHIHHVAIFYEVKYLGGTPSYSSDVEENDSIGAEWVNMDELTSENCSPLVNQAIAWISGDPSNVKVKRLDGWIVKP